ncbi:signal-regulatory protein beta-2-like [Trichomycterus rosablanca]|uniref:signal-regulatory protein beta-2-like n=1 Tax=Trichomycterus rosablanca TaxID=2290929 RepID=UPI002F35765E
MILYFYLLLITSIYHSYSEDELWQESLRTAVVGDNITLTCVTSKQRKTSMMWLKQTFGERPLVIATSYQSQTARFQNGFDETGRFFTDTADKSFNLSLTNTELSDSATYYCAVVFLYEISFGKGTVLFVKDRPVRSTTILQEKNFLSVHPGDSVTLQCTVVAEHCAGEHSVFWIRHGSGGSHPGIIYTDGDSSDQCKNRSVAGSSTQSCIYSLPKRNLSTSDAGTYYCAVATCGEILFGNGTKLDIKGEDFQIKLLVLLSIVRAVVLLFLVTAFLVYSYVHK